MTGVSVGHASDPEVATGVTVVRFDRACPTVVEVRGGASATYDTGSLSLDATFGRRWAIFFSGGSLFGLDAGRGVRDCLLEAGAGGGVFGHPQRLAPITGAALFDLPRRGGRLPDYTSLGHRAASVATRDPVASGAVGAGTGASVAKYRGREFARPGGVGSASASIAGLGWVGAIAAVNSVGAVWDPEDHAWVAVAEGRGGRRWPPSPGAAFKSGVRTPRGTTLVAVVCEAGLDRAGLQRVAMMASAGLARAVIPVFTATDGDVVFAASTEVVRPPKKSRYPQAAADAVGAVAADLVARATVRAVSTPSATGRRG